jgi:dTMP kinase
LPVNLKLATRQDEERVAGTFITFEGIDGSGKSTQLRMLANFLKQTGCDVLLTREPGGTPVGNRLRAALLDAQEEVDPLTELLVFAADRAQHVRRVLRPALESGQVVFSDRYADATAAYQGAGRGFSPELISEIIELATEGLKPDLTLLFDLSVHDSTTRTRRRSDGKQQGDRLDAENAEFHTRVRDEYLRLARAEPERMKIIETNQPVEVTHERVKEIVVPFLQGRGHVCGDELEEAASADSETRK